MKDYKELIAELRTHILAPPRQKTTIEQQAADAIVQLIKERDAAIAFVPRVCKTCKRDGLQYLAGGKLDSLCDTCRRNRRCNWEWRGVQEGQRDGND